MSATVGTVKRRWPAGGELLVFEIAGGAGANVNVDYNFGQTPVVYWTVAEGAATAVAPVISATATRIIVYVSSGHTAKLYVLQGGE